MSTYRPTNAPGSRRLGPESCLRAAPGYYGMLRTFLDFSGPIRAYLGCSGPVRVCAWVPRIPISQTHRVCATSQPTTAGIASHGRQSVSPPCHAQNQVHTCESLTMTTTVASRTFTPEADDVERLDSLTQGGAVRRRCRCRCVVDGETCLSQTRPSDRSLSLRQSCLLCRICRPVTGPAGAEPGLPRAADSGPPALSVTAALSGSILLSVGESASRLDDGMSRA